MPPAAALQGAAAGVENDGKKHLIERNRK